MKNIEQRIANAQRFLADIPGNFSDATTAYWVTSYYKRIGDELYLAPFSTTTQYGGCYPGGYVDFVTGLVQMCNVMDTVYVRSMKSYDEKYDRSYTKDDLMVAAYLCCIGRLNEGNLMVMLDNPEEWERVKRGILYIHNPEITPLRYEDRTLFNLQRDNYSVSDVVYTALRLYTMHYNTDQQQAYFATMKQDLNQKFPLYKVLFYAYDLNLVRFNTYAR